MEMDNNTMMIIAGVILVLALAYYFLVYKKRPSSVAVGSGETLAATPEGFPVIPDPASQTPAQRKMVDDYRTGLENYM